MGTTSVAIYDIPARHHIHAPSRGFNHTNIGTRERLASIVSGMLFTTFGLRRASPIGYAMAAAGGVLLFRGVTGYCPVTEVLTTDHARKHTHDTAVRIKESVTIDRPRSELYAYWRDVERLPTFMHHLEFVRHIDETHSEWRARGPKGVGTFTWSAEIVEDEPGELIAWSSLPDASIQNAGEVRFIDAPGNRGTEVHVNIEYRPPVGDVGLVAAKIINPVFSQLIREDVRRFKRLMESGTLLTSNEGRPRCE